jgi:membrane protease subunit (stomatin/prohibitin family)
MKAAAGNENGAMMGFLGMGFAQQAGGMNAQNLFALGRQGQPQTPYGVATGGSFGFAGQQQPGQPAQQPAPMGWACSCGHAGNESRFCEECGKPQPAADGWTCACGAVNKGKFCGECGKPKPAGVPQYKCDKCGWEPADKTRPPKFCPECGDPFDDGDVK